MKLIPQNYKPIAANEVTVLPEPDSPTMPSTSPFARAKYFSPLRSRLVLRCQFATMGAVNHQYVHKPLRIPNHPFVGAKYFSPRRRPLVARNRLSVSAPHHLWHGRNIFRPYARNCCATSYATFQFTAHAQLMGCMLGMGIKYFARATIATQSTHEHLAHKLLNAIGIIEVK